MPTKTDRSMRAPVKLRLDGKEVWTFPNVSTNAMTFFVVSSPHYHGGWLFETGELIAVIHRSVDTAGPAAGGTVHGEWLGSYEYDRTTKKLGPRLTRVKIIAPCPGKRVHVDSEMLAELTGKHFPKNSPVTS